MREWLLVGGLLNTACAEALIIGFEPCRFSIVFVVFAAILFVAGVGFAITGLQPAWVMSEPIYITVPRNCLHMTYMFLAAGGVFALIAVLKPVIDAWV